MFSLSYLNVRAGRDESGWDGGGWPPGVEHSCPLELVNLPLPFPLSHVGRLEVPQRQPLAPSSADEVPFVSQLLVGMFGVGLEPAVVGRRSLGHQLFSIPAFLCDYCVSFTFWTCTFYPGLDKSHRRSQIHIQISQWGWSNKLNELQTENYLLSKIYSLALSLFIFTLSFWYDRSDHRSFDFYCI